MSATTELFDAWKKAKGYTTDTAAGHALKVSKQAVNNWRTRDGNAEAHVIERMAQDLGRDPVPVILQAFAEAAKNADAARSLGKLARKLGAACVALVMLAPMIPSSAHAAEVSDQIFTRHIHYAKWLMSRIARLSRSVSLARARWLTPTEPPQCSLFASNPATP